MKFTYDWKWENGEELKWWLVTDLDGECVRDTQVNGEPMTSESCLKLLPSGQLVDDNRIVLDRYSLNREGARLRIHRVNRISPAGRKLPDVDLILNRMSQ
ncbi:MAG TPA: hypothetical protein VME18_08925 [Acidobacteriaceae bacterium]|nr:hypothetical protein [Acidobacteriaceae bacterium]